MDANVTPVRISGGVVTANAITLLPDAGRSDHARFTNQCPLWK
jgi:hypothetical protein